MQIIRSTNELKTGARRVCAAIGVFDGLHVGHQAVLERAREDARAIGGLLVVVTFDRHPNHVVAPERAPMPIYTLEYKLSVLASMRVDVTWLIEFNREFSQMSAEEFVHRLVRDFAPLHSLSVGAGFTFGHRRGGDLNLLTRMGQECGFHVHGLAPVAMGGEPVSSTRIRESIRAGDLAAAGAMLGRPYSVVGRVVPGNRMGRQIGVPTANVGVGGLLLPPDGVYAVEVKFDDEVRPGVANLGFRPTVSAEPKDRQLEVHLLDYAGDLYGRELEVILRRHLRGEIRFNSVVELEAQIQRDIGVAREVLGVAGGR